MRGSYPRAGLSPGGRGRGARDGADLPHAIAAGVTKRLWEVSDIVDVMEAWERAVLNLTRHLAAALPNATIESLKGASHMSPFTHPAELNRLILDHLAAHR